MKKGFVKSSLLSVVALAVILASLTVVLVRPAEAQGNGNGNGNSSARAISSGPIRLSSEHGQRVISSYSIYSQSGNRKTLETGFDIVAHFQGPTGPTSVHETVFEPHVFELKSGPKSAELVQNGDNFDIYVDGVRRRGGILNGLPPGIPVEYFTVNTYTIVTGASSSDVIDGSMQVVAADGETVAFVKKGELLGNVILMK